VRTLAWEGEWRLERAGREILRGPVVSGDNYHRLFAVKTAFSADAPVTAAYESRKETSMKKLVIATAVALAAIVSVIVVIQGQKKNKIALTLDVEKVSIISQQHEFKGGVLGEAVYQLKNEADVPIVAIMFESDDRRSRFLRTATIDGHNERKVVAPAQTTFEIRVSLDPDTSYNNLVAVEYADGTVSGREDAAKYLKQRWEEAYKEAGERSQ
jgi:hypothetical protein